MKKADNFLRGVELLRTDRVYEFSNVFGTRPAYDHCDVVKGLAAGRFSPEKLLISTDTLCAEPEPRWDRHWVKGFGLAPITIRLNLNPGVTSGDYISFSDFLRIEASAEFKSLKREWNAKQKETAARIEREYAQFQAEQDTYKRAIEVVSNPSASNAKKAVAYRTIAAYRVECGSCSSSGVEEALGLAPGTAKSAKTLTALVNEGKLSRRREVGWVYDRKSVQDYVLELAAQMEGRA